MNAEAYRRYAAGCARLAPHCADPREQALWFRIAEDWLYLARAVESRDNPSETGEKRRTERA